LIAAPETIWSARRLTANTAWSSPMTPPATRPMTIPPIQLCVMSAPQAPKNAPVSIIPSRPMLTTPDRSEMTPPSAPNVSGVAKRSAAATSADHTTTRSRFPTPDFTAP
jgi:hypothetical protein